MKALPFHGKGDMRCENVPDPKIEHPRDAIIKITACAICGSDLHISDGVISDIQHGDVLGHENMGEVVEVGTENNALKVGDRVVVPFTISCGECFFCKCGFFLATNGPTTITKRLRYCGGIHPPDSLDTRICWVDRRSISAFPSLTSAPSKYPRD